MRREAVTLRWLAHPSISSSLGILQALDLATATPMHDVLTMPAYAFASFYAYIHEHAEAPRNPLVSLVRCNESAFLTKTIADA
jgi:hypothetical protein